MVVGSIFLISSATATMLSSTQQPHCDTSVPFWHSSHCVGNPFSPWYFSRVTMANFARVSSASGLYGCARNSNVLLYSNHKHRPADAQPIYLKGTSLLELYRNLTLHYPVHPSGSRGVAAMVCDGQRVEGEARHLLPQSKTDETQA